MKAKDEMKNTLFKTYDEVDKILCHYRHLGGGVSIIRDESDEMELAFCFGYNMPYIVILKGDREYIVKYYGTCPAAYKHLLYEI